MSACCPSRRERRFEIDAERVVERREPLRLSRTDPLEEQLVALRREAGDADGGVEVDERRVLGGLLERDDEPHGRVHRILAGRRPMLSLVSRSRPRCSGTGSPLLPSVKYATDLRLPFLQHLEVRGREAAHRLVVPVGDDDRDADDLDARTKLLWARAGDGAREAASTTVAIAAATRWTAVVITIVSLPAAARPGRLAYNERLNARFKAVRQIPQDSAWSGPNL